MSDDNVTWEPVGDGFVHKHDTGMALDVRYVAWQGDDNSINVGRVDYGPHGSCPLPPDIRLCRAVAAPTWSQDVPTEEGWYWFVGKLVQPYEYNPQIYTIRTITPMYLFWTIVPVECLIIDHADFIWRAEHAQGHWMPATVPQPPGEVGE